jgi:hypothetical protein
MVCPPGTSEAGARRPRSISNYGVLCQTRKTPTLAPASKVAGGHTLPFLNLCQRPYAMLKAPVPSITVVKQHWAQSVLGWVTAYKRVNHTKDWLALLLARCCIASWGIDPDAPWRRDAWLYGTPWWVLAQTRQKACDRLETTVMRPSGTRENKQTNIFKLADHAFF